MTTAQVVQTVLAILAGLGVLGFAGRFAWKAARNQVVNDLWERLEPRFEKVVERSIAPLEGQLHVVVKAVGELQPNGGSSMKDQIAELHRVAYRLRPDPPSGWPI